MSLHASPVPTPIAAPEGHHFAFDDDGHTLGLSIIGKARLAIVQCAILLPTGLLIVGLSQAFASAGVPVVRWLIFALGALFLIGFLNVALSTWIGHERIEFGENDIRIRRYTPFRTRRVLPLRNCRGIGVLPPRYEDGKPEVVIFIGETKGRSGLVLNDDVYRFGCVLNDEEAEAVTAFIIAKRPQLRRFRFQKEGRKWTAASQES